MASGKRFSIPSLDDMDVVNELPQTTFRRGFQVRTAPSTSSFNSTNPVFSQVDSKECSEEMKQKGSNQESEFQRCFGKLKSKSHHQEIREDVKKMKTSEMTDAAANLLAKPRQPASSNSILVNPRQQGNPLLPFIRNVPWEYSSIVPDYVMGRTTCALFLSIRYHNLNPEYIHNRLKPLGDMYSLRILLVLVDVKDSHVPLQQLTKIAFLTDCTLLLAWSPEEAGRYIETYKVFENKPATVLMKKQDPDTLSKMISALTSVKSINRNDALMLLITFGTLENVFNASQEQLSFVPGVGEHKAKKLYSVFHQPFLKGKKS